ncbi:M15 family metallopeptidase [Maricurvus nonylphenolicus]|uniref:M15 family metallopeptidase n=1 Tax=Maricurvus nonylphenolicus TaxID=1008307 RepID=UPI0036F3EBE4
MTSAQHLLDQACGKTEDHLCTVAGLPGLFHRQMVDDLQALCADARQAGFQLSVASSFRSFERQLAIWSGKVSGGRPVLDSGGQPLAIQTLTEEELMWAILRWSALPGASRHHWGTDIDVFDGSAVSEDYQLQLVPAEYSGEGPFSTLTDWLTERIADGRAYGFFRPYANDCGGVAPEPWHLSYAPVAQQYAALQTPENLLPLWRAVKLPLLPQVEAHIDEIVTRFIRV